MPWYDFLRPTMGKIVLFVILMGALNYYAISSGYRPDIRYLAGWPLGFWPIGFAFIRNPPPINFSPVNFIIDILFWYVFSASIIALTSGTKNPKTAK